HPDGDFLAVEWIDRIPPGKHAVLFNRSDVSSFPGSSLLADQLIDFVAKVVVIGSKIGDQRMLGRKLHRSRAEDRVNARGEDADLVPGGPRRAIEPEVHQRAFAAPNPVALHGADFFRPAFQLVKTG